MATRLPSHRDDQPRQAEKTVLIDDRTYNVLSVKQGGMGRVWLLAQTFDEPFDPIYRRQIAAKTFDEGSDRGRIEEELNIWISLQNPFILPLKKIGRLNYRLAAIMPLMTGSLDDLLEARGSMSEQNVTRILRDTINALLYAWNSFKILHLDLKPSNILIEDESARAIKVADWGISRIAAERRMSRGFGAVRDRAGYFDLHTAYSAGTALFMAPERFSGKWGLSPAVDIYSLGMMAIHLNTGVLPFRVGEIDPGIEISQGSYYSNAELLLEQRSPQFRRLCLCCIHPDPARRPSRYEDLLRMLNAVPS
jgi:serine/threonine protein kinase